MAFMGATSCNDYLDVDAPSKYTEDFIFTVNVLSENTSGAVIGALGFTSGRDGSKLDNVRHKILQEGVPVIQEDICCWFLCKVVHSVETVTHTIFIAEPIAGSESIKGKPMTYEFYTTVINIRKC